jgi:hypothetical protein
MPVAGRGEDRGITANANDRLTGFFARAAITSIGLKNGEVEICHYFNTVRGIPNLLYEAIGRPQTGQHPSKGSVMKTKFVAVIALPLVLTLSACGDTWGERAVTGGGIGAGAGLALGAVAGWPLLAPILVGTAVGAGIGAASANNK